MDFLKPFRRDWETAQWVKCLLNKHEGLGSIPSTCLKSQVQRHATATPMLQRTHADPATPLHNLASTASSRLSRAQ